MPPPPGAVTAPLALVGAAGFGNVHEDSEQCLGRPPLGAVAGAGLRAPQLAPPVPLETLLSIPTFPDSIFFTLANIEVFSSTHCAAGGALSW